MAQNSTMILQRSKINIYTQTMNIKKHILILTTILYTCYCSTYIDPTTNCNNTCDGSFDSPFETIQQGLDANQGSSMVLLPGVYKGEGNHDLVVNSRFLEIESADGAEDTLLDCEGQTGAFHLSSATITLKGFTIKNCVKDKDEETGLILHSGGAIFANSSFLKLIDMVFKSNEASKGGTLYFENQSVEIYNSTFEDNSAEHGGIVFLKSANLKMYNPQQEDHSAENGDLIYCESAAVQLYDNIDNFMADYDQLDYNQREELYVCNDCSIVYDDIDFCQIQPTEDSSSVILSSILAVLMLML
eukprot:TRINITY_DN7694_c0_g1_i1.p1 TRINITY_DN7694_c0_g1~~TRINITY_DN7694_c0_g1_i1.p1  ORF type:complete len:302 (+),score=59.45 TRINITY_DN7694_c0_g1_i1:15-920(+)